MPGHQLLSFKGPQSLGEHAVGDVRNRGLDDAVAGAPLQECLQDSAGPTTTDELDSAVESGADRGGGGR